MTFFNLLSHPKDLKNYRLSKSCYQYVRKFCKKFFINSSSGVKTFADPTYLPNKLKFTHTFSKSIILKKDSNFSLDDIFNEHPNADHIIIHVCCGKSRLHTIENKRLRYLLIANHSYRVPRKVICEKIHIKVKESPIIFLINIPIQNPLLLLTEAPSFYSRIDPPSFVFVDCEMAFARIKRKFILCLTSVAIIDETGETLFNQLVTPVPTIRNYVTRITGLNEHKLRGKLDERIALHKVHNIIQNKIIVGCGLTNDLKVLKLTDIPDHRKIDIGMSNTLIHVSGLPQLPMGLKKLAATILGEDIQQGHHTAHQDALTTFRIFDKNREALIREFCR